MKPLFQAGFVYKTALRQKSCMEDARIILTTRNSRRTPVIFRPTEKKKNRWRVEKRGYHKWMI